MKDSSAYAVEVSEVSVSRRGIPLTNRYDRPATRARALANAQKARVALRGDDEFSIASIEEDQSEPVELTGNKLAPPIPEEEIDRPEEGSFWTTLRRVFGR